MGNVMQEAGYKTAHYGKWCALAACRVMAAFLTITQQPDTCYWRLELLQACASS
jgi:hypothetical protein